MTRLNRHINAAAAERFAAMVREGDKGRQELVADVDAWFADSYGWPLSRTQLEQRREFLGLIDEALKESQS